MTIKLDGMNRRQVNRRQVLAATGVAALAAGAGIRPAAAAEVTIRDRIRKVSGR